MMGYGGGRRGRPGGRCGGYQSLERQRGIARQESTATVQWISNEGTSTTESSQIVVSVPLAPRHMSVYIERSRNLELLAPDLTEQLIRNDLTLLKENALDAVAIAGNGTSQPQGIVGTAGVGTFTGANVAWAGILEGQSDVLSSNALVNPGTFAYVTTVAVAELLAKRQGFSANAPMWLGGLDEGTLAGARAFSSGSVPSATIVAGDWSQVVVGEFGAGIELRVNPLANFPAGIVGIAMDYYYDVAITFPTAFSVATSVS